MYSNSSFINCKNICVGDAGSMERAHKWLLRQIEYTSEQKYTIMYLKYIYFVLSILQKYLHIYVLNKNTRQLYFYYTNLVYTWSLLNWNN